MANNSEIGLILTAFMTLLVGIILLSNVSNNLYAATTLSANTDEDITISTTTTTVTRETINITSDTGNTTFTPVMSVTFFGNMTINTTDLGVNITLHVNWTQRGVITVQGVNFTDGDYNISYTYISSGTGTTEQDDIVSVSYFGNRTMNTTISGMDIDDEVNWTEAGAITTNPWNFTAGNYNITYDYEDDEYVVNATARTLINMIEIFFAIAVMLVGFWYAYRAYKSITGN